MDVPDGLASEAFTILAKRFRGRGAQIYEDKLPIDKANVTIQPWSLIWGSHFLWC